MSNLLRDKEFQKLIAFFGGAFLLIVLAITFTPGGWASLIRDLNALWGFVVAIAGMIIGSKYAFHKLARRMPVFLAWLLTFIIFMVLPFIVVLWLGGQL